MPLRSLRTGTAAGLVALATAAGLTSPATGPALAATPTATTATTAHGVERRPGDGGFGDTAVPLPDRGDDPVLTVVSSPDFMNADVGDVSGLARWDGVHNSINDRYVTATGVVLEQLRAEEPDAVLVAGDLVEGHWGVDVDRTGIFGPVDTPARARAAVGRAGALYFGAWARLFARHGLPLPHVAVGDHEIGDDPWPGGSFDLAAVPTYKRTFAEALVGARYARSHRPVGTPYAATSYWTALSPEVMLVSVDVFEPRPATGAGRDGMRLDLSGAHLRWFRRTLAEGRERFRWVVVQGHVPALGPVRTSGSSGLRLDDGPRSRMWRAMTSADVDLYLAGEVHDVTAIARRGQPVQVTHGGLFAFGGTTYLRLDVFEDRLELSTYGFDTRVDRDSGTLWQTSEKRAVPRDLRYEPGRRLRGSAVLTPTGRLVTRSGDLAPATELDGR
ncbi:metallophosphoesterase family protein [Nocardioides sp. Leaf285]|uniref:metallophosphoesterase family protein n=1 Tax=Nocardioides sp. Leaf285 TaxID=1736322 RepID=UPI000702534B|nr:metallophosphoesterase [Nocardioides sp. Leaf285]KQP64596.1 hypothetical protein ASF47_11660 [Nocardioides sp. Leaf285]